MNAFVKGILFVVCLAASSLATEVLHPILPPANAFAFKGVCELDEDVYSGDLIASVELSPVKRLGFYSDASFRLLSYSYEYSMKGYVHNYANLHVNGFNETYVGAKALFTRHLGFDLNWRLPPGEGSQKQRFHRFGFAPFAVYGFGENLQLGTMFRYNIFLEDANYKPGDEIGVMASFVWRPFWKAHEKSGWQLTEIFLYQARIEESENRNMLGPYRKMDDAYRGMKLQYEVVRYFDLFGFLTGIGLNYEMHEGNLFGLETGHRLGFSIKVNN